ncbi:MAG TPA: hypothetical protein VGP21_07250, partial [Opitutaceae bacterium]|nr:hypothetical protein [Opitutaceae bacterium]
MEKREWMRMNANKKEKPDDCLNMFFGRLFSVCIAPLSPPCTYSRLFASIRVYSRLSMWIEMCIFKNAAV